MELWTCLPACGQQDAGGAKLNFGQRRAGWPVPGPLRERPLRPGTCNSMGLASGCDCTILGDLYPTPKALSLGRALSEAGSHLCSPADRSLSPKVHRGSKKRHLLPKVPHGCLLSPSLLHEVAELQRHPPSASLGLDATCLGSDPAAATNPEFDGLAWAGTVMRRLARLSQCSGRTDASVRVSGAPGETASESNGVGSAALVLAPGQKAPRASGVSLATHAWPLLIPTASFLPTLELILLAPDKQPVSHLDTFAPAASPAWSTRTCRTRPRATKTLRKHTPYMYTLTHHTHTLLCTRRELSLTSC